MNATNYYVSTTRLVLQGDPDTPSTWQDLYRMLPTLRNSLSCTVCDLLLVEPYTPDETSCEHHVCKSCKGGVKTLKPTCSWCKDYTKYNENVQLRILIQNYKKLCGLIKITRMWGHIMRQGDQGQQIRDIISESEGERKGVRKPLVLGTDLKVEDEEEMEEHEELVEEEIVGECEVVPLGMEGICCEEPPDEIISSPISKLNMYRSDVSLERVENVKAKLDKDFEIKEESKAEDVKKETLPVPPLSVPISTSPQSTTPSPSKTSTPSPPNVQKYLSSSSTTSTSSSSTKAPWQANKSGIRKIKAEAFILNPLKTKSDFPQFRRLDSTPKAAQRSFSHDGAPPTKHPKLAEQVKKVRNEATSSVIQKTEHHESPSVRAESVIVKQELVAQDRLSIDSLEDLSCGESSRGKVKRKSGCRCGNATLCPGKLTCCGQRCPCYVDNLACLDCKCKGCRNPHMPGGGKVRPAIPLMQNMQVVYPTQGTRTQEQTVYSSSRVQADKIVFQPARSFSDKVVYTARSPEKVVKSFGEKVVYPGKAISDKVVYSTNRLKTDSTTVRMPVNVGDTFSLKDIDLTQLPILNLDTGSKSASSQMSTVSVPLSSISTSTIRLNSPLMGGGSTTSSQNPIRLQPRSLPSLSTGARIRPMSVISVLGSSRTSIPDDEMDSLELLQEDPTISLLPEEEDLDLDIDYA